MAQDNLNSSTKDQLVFEQTKAIGKLLTGVAFIETVFYLPNHFRQSILVNSNKISFANKDQALLDLMNIMFKLSHTHQANGGVIQEFKISNFFACYRPFFL